MTSKKGNWRVWIVIYSFGPKERVWSNARLQVTVWLWCRKKLNQYDVGSGFHFITEFQFQKSAEVWVPVRTHGECFPQAGDGGWSFNLHGCEDVLMLRNLENGKFQYCWFLNFSTSEWHTLPEKLLEDEDVSLMCRIFWHVIP